MCHVYLSCTGHACTREMPLSISVNLTVILFPPELGASHLIPRGGGGGPGFDPRVFWGFFSVEGGVLFFFC